MDWITSINDIKFAEQNKDLAFIPGLDDLTCTMPTSEAIVPVNTVLPGEFLCQYDAHCSAQCMCCDFYACDCRFQCPDGCSCFHDQDWSQNIVQCSERGHKHIPILVPLDSTTVFLDGNNFRHLETQSFLGRDNVRELYLNSSNIVTLGNNTFSGLTNLEVLHLEDNNIAEISGTEFTALTLIQELYLHNNDLVYINEIAFETLRNLRTLRLDGNLLTVFPAWQLMNNFYLTSLSLSRNTWSCECDFIQPFNDFLESRAMSIVDYDDIQCVSDNIIDEQSIRNGRVLCPKARNKPLTRYPGLTTQTPYKYDFTPVVVAGILLSVFVISCVLAVIVFRRKIESWFYKNSSDIYESRNGSVGSGAVSSNYSAEPTRKLFDVYITYSGKDSDFVDQTLAPTLEHGSAAYKLCLQQRDFLQNATIYESVAEATVSSSKVLVVMSKTYLETEWPHVKAPLRNTLNNDSGKIVFLFIDDVTDADLAPHPELVQYLSTSSSLVWGSPGCINQLRFLLPEPAFLTFHRNVTLRHQHRLPQPLPPAPPSYLQANLYGLHRAPSSTIYNGRSEHTYHSIPENHIYHTLEPSKLFDQHQLTIAGSKPSPGNQFSVYHSHSHSSSSGTQLIPVSPLNGGSNDEYIV